MAVIPLLNSTENTLIDDRDFEWLSNYTWYLKSDRYVWTKLPDGREVRMGSMIFCKHGTPKYLIHPNGHTLITQSAVQKYKKWAKAHPRAPKHASYYAYDVSEI